MQHAAFSAAACLPLGHYLTLPVRLACNLQPLAASAKQRPAFAASGPTHALIAHAYNTRFAFPVLHVLLHAALQHAAARRGAAAYGDAYLLFGRPKMLISAYPFAHSFVAP